MHKLECNDQEVYKYMGFRGSKPDVASLGDIEKAKEALSKITTNKFLYRVAELDKSEGICVVDSNLRFQGEQIKELLADADTCILIAVTLGEEVDRMIRKAQIVDLNYGFALDAVASSMAEHFCNQVEAELKNIWYDKGYYFTDRFSPGYGDLPLETQRELCYVMETSKRMGLHVSASGLLMPRKSITAIIGISKNPQPMRIKGCGYCELRNHCNYRVGGSTCHE